MFLKELGCALFVLLIELVVCIAPEIVAVLTITLSHPHLLYKFEKLDIDKRFYKLISNYMFSRDIQEFNSLWTYLILNVVVLNIDVFYFQIEDWIMS